jgi:predicted RNA-binding protein with EMAP domain
MHTITENIEIREVGAPVAAGATIDNSSDRIDMDDYESVTFIAVITDSVATGVAALTIESNDADSDSGMAAITGAVATVTSVANDDVNDKLLIVEVRNPGKRFVQAVRTSLTANIAYGSVIALLTPRRRPVVDHTTVADIARVSD